MQKIKGGKIRDVYEYSENYGNELCFVASDRVPAFDGLEIEGKGRILTMISSLWSELIDFDSGSNHCFKTAYVGFDDEQKREIEAAGIDLATAQSQLALEMLPVEVEVYGYLTGPLWQEYQSGVRDLYGLRLPNDLKKDSPLPESLFLPRVKTLDRRLGDVLTFDELVETIEEAELSPPMSYCEYNIRTLAETIREWSIDIYDGAARYAKKCGIIIASTSFKFGLCEDGKLMFGGEILTPDTSRLWRAVDHRLGYLQKSLDAQIIRDYLESEQREGETEITLPPQIIKRMQDTYEEVLNRLLPGADVDVY